MLVLWKSRVAAQMLVSGGSTYHVVDFLCTGSDNKINLCDHHDLAQIVTIVKTTDQ